MQLEEKSSVQLILPNTILDLYTISSLKFSTNHKISQL